LRAVERRQRDLAVETRSEPAVMADEQQGCIGGDAFARQQVEKG
jgi:hypothetical protein